VRSVAWGLRDLASLALNTLYSRLDVGWTALATLK